MSFLTTFSSDCHTNYSFSLSEYGCITNTRKFEEVASLYGSDMTPVYSGGLVYEYSQEVSGYGLVSISGSQVSELPDFGSLQSAFKATPNPSGNGGAKTSGTASTCPSKSDTWQVADDSLPAMPAGAVKYLKQGAGTGPGLKGNNGAGSQNAGTASSGTATAGSGQPSVTGTAAASGVSSTSTSSASASASAKSAAGSLRSHELALAPIVCGLVVVASTFLGALLL